MGEREGQRKERREPGSKEGQGDGERFVGREARIKGENEGGRVARRERNGSVKLQSHGTANLKLSK